MVHLGQSALEDRTDRHPYTTNHLPLHISVPMSVLCHLLIYVSVRHGIACLESQYLGGGLRGGCQGFKVILCYTTNLRTNLASDKHKENKIYTSKPGMVMLKLKASLDYIVIPPSTIYVAN